MSTGIIVRIDWNENKWEKPSDNLELANNFEYVKENKISHTSFNFAQNLYYTEPDGLWYGLIPAFFSKKPDKDKIKDLKIVFLISNNEGSDYIIGLYAFPVIGNKKRKKLISGYHEYDLINIGAELKNVFRLKNYVAINSLNLKKALGNQKISLRGWNYIQDENVGYIFDSIESVNSNCNELKQIKFRCLK